MLARLAELAPAGSGWGEPAAARFRDDVANALNVPTSGLSPHRAVEVAREVLPRDTIATCDAGASRLLVVQKWLSFGPREFLASNGLGSMGYAVPGALAARLAWPDRPAVAFAGDGGLLMAVAELQTSVRENLPIIVVVFDDEEIGLIRVKQEIKGSPVSASAWEGWTGRRSPQASEPTAWWWKPSTSWAMRCRPRPRPDARHWSRPGLTAPPMSTSSMR